MQFLAFRIHSEKLEVVALKSTQQIRAAYEPLAAKVIVCDSGALARPRRSTLPFQNVQRPNYPLDVIERKVSCYFQWLTILQARSKAARVAPRLAFP